jgi:hypothetical protein
LKYFIGECGLALALGALACLLYSALSEALLHVVMETRLAEKVLALVEVYGPPLVHLHILITHQAVQFVPEGTCFHRRGKMIGPITGRTLEILL